MSDALIDLAWKFGATGIVGFGCFEAIKMVRSLTPKVVEYLNDQRTAMQTMTVTLKELSERVGTLGVHLHDTKNSHAATIKEVREEVDSVRNGIHSDLERLQEQVARGFQELRDHNDRLHREAKSDIRTSMNGMFKLGREIGEISAKGARKPHETEDELPSVELPVGDRPSSSGLARGSS